MAIRSGQLRWIISIQDYTVTYSGTGEAVKAYSNIAGAVNIPAKYRQIGAQEAVRLGQTNAKVTVEFTFRKPVPEVLSRHRVVMGSRTFEIVTVTDVYYRGDYLKIIAEELT